MLNPLWLYHTLFPFFFLLHLAGEYISPASARVLLVLITFLLSSSQGGAILSLWLLHSAVFAVAWLVSRSNFSFPYIPQFAVIDFPKRPSSIVTLPFIFYDAHMRTTHLPVGRFGRFLRLRILLMSLLTYDLVMNLKLTFDDTLFPLCGRPSPISLHTNGEWTFHRMLYGTSGPRDVSPSKHQL